MNETTKFLQDFITRLRKLSDEELTYVYSEVEWPQSIYTFVKGDAAVPKVVTDEEEFQGGKTPK